MDVAAAVAGRVGDALPVTVTQPFRAMGVPLATDHHVLHVIASRGGAPLRQDTDYLEITLWSCSALSAVMLLVFALSAWVIRRRERGKARRSETP